MDMSVSLRPETKSATLEDLVTQRAREIAEQEVRKVLSEFLARVQALLAPVPDAAEYLTITQAAKKYRLNENTIRRVVALGKLASVQKPVVGPRGTRQVLMVGAGDLDKWFRSR